MNAFAHPSLHGGAAEAPRWQAEVDANSPAQGLDLNICTLRVRRCLKRFIARQLFKLLEHCEQPGVEVLRAA
jgi:hypothetical protein